MPVLWIPSHLAESGGPRAQPDNPVRFWVLQLGYSDLFGQKPTWDDVRARLDRYSLRAVLDVTARLSAFLDNVEGEQREVEAQKRLVDGFFGAARGAEVWQAVIRSRQERPEVRTVAVFGELQLINAVKVALLCMPAEDRATADSLAELGEALLMINDLMWAQLEPPVPLDRTAGMPPEWQQMLLANHLFHGGGTWRNDLARSFELYLMDRPHLHTDPAYVDLPAQVRALTGMDPHALWTILFALAAHWQTINENNLYEVNGGIDRTSYFTAHYSFAAAEVESFFRLCSADVAETQQAVRDRYTLEHLDPLDILPLARAPLISVGQMVYLASSRLLADKLTRGFYHAFLDQDRTTKAARDRFLTYMGSVFEDYVSALMARLYPAVSNRYVGEAILKARIPGKHCDGLILYGDSVVLLEVKATLFPLDVRAARNWKQFQRLRQDVLVDAAEQMNATIDAIQAGILRPDGVDPGHINSYLPVVVTHEDVGMTRPLHKYVVEEVESKGLLRQRGTLRLQAVSIGELEALEEDLHAGQSLQRILAEKIALEEWRDEALRNYCYARRPDLMRGRNAYLLQRFQTLYEGALAFFRKHDAPEVM